MKEQTITGFRVAVVSTLPPERCGIADYAWRQAEAIRKNSLLTVETIRLVHGISPFPVIRAAREAVRSNVVHVHLDISFFGTIPLPGTSLSGVWLPLFYHLVRSRRVVTTVHEVIDASKYTGLRGLVLRPYYRFVYRPVLRSRVLAHTRGAIDRLGQYGELREARPIPFPVYRDAPGSLIGRDDAKRRLGLAGDRVLLLYGYVNRNKGHDLAVHALALLPEDVVLYVAGAARTPEDEAYRQEVHDLACELGVQHRVFWHGWAGDMELPLIFAAADIVLFPYRDTVQSAALHEALAHGKPILASKIGGFAEINIDHNAVVVFKPGSARCLAKGAARLLDEPLFYREMVLNARKYADHADGDAVARRLILETYKELLFPERPICTGCYIGEEELKKEP